MPDLNRGIMKFDNADQPSAVLLSAVLVLGGIGAAITWGLQTAYAID